jgi:hypothetical protein
VGQGLSTTAPAAHQGKCACSKIEHHQRHHQHNVYGVEAIETIDPALKDKKKNLHCLLRACKSNERSLD